MKKVGKKSGGASNRKILWTAIGLFVVMPLVVLGYAIYDAGASRAKLEKIHEQIAEPEWELVKTSSSGNYQCFKSCIAASKTYQITNLTSDEFVSYFSAKLSALGGPVGSKDNDCSTRNRDYLPLCSVFIKDKTNNIRIGIALVESSDNNSQVVISAGYESHFFGHYKE